MHTPTFVQIFIRALLAITNYHEGHLSYKSYQTKGSTYTQGADIDM